MKAFEVRLWCSFKEIERERASRAATLLESNDLRLSAHSDEAIENRNKTEEEAEEEAEECRMKNEDSREKN